MAEQRAARHVLEQLQFARRRRGGCARRAVWVRRRAAEGGSRAAVRARRRAARQRARRHVRRRGLAVHCFPPARIVVVAVEVVGEGLDQQVERPKVEHHQLQLLTPAGLRARRTRRAPRKNEEARVVRRWRATRGARRTRDDDAARAPQPRASRRGREAARALSSRAVSLARAVGLGDAPARAAARGARTQPPLVAGHTHRRTSWVAARRRGARGDDDGDATGRPEKKPPFGCDLPFCWSNGRTCRCCRRSCPAATLRTYHRGAPRRGRVC